MTTIPRLYSSPQPKRVFAIVLLLGLALRLAPTVANVETIVRIVPDDTFYYLKVARNIAAGLGSTYDGVNVTNGYHPLWMLALLPVTSLDQMTFVRAAMLATALLNLGATVLLWLWLRRSTDLPWLATFVAGLYVVLPPVVTTSLMGLEASLATFLYATASWFIIRTEQHSLKGDVVIAGLLAGLFYARTDTIFFVVVFGLIVLIRTKREHRLRRGLVIAGASSLLVAPWLAWNWANFGSPVQASGMAVPYVLHSIYGLVGHSADDIFRQSLVYFLSFLISTPFAWIAVLLTMVAAIVRRRSRLAASVSSAVLRSLLRDTLLMWLAGLLLIFTHTFLRWYPREWYFDQLYWLSAVSVGLIVMVGHSGLLPQSNRRVSTGPGWRRAAVVAGGSLTLVVSGLSLQQLTTGVYPWQSDMLEGAHWLTDHLAEPTMSAAAFNAGIYGYFSDRRVINLDGVINQAAYQALLQHDLMNFVRASGIRYLIDYAPLMFDLYGSFGGPQADLAVLKPVVTIGPPRSEIGNSRIQVYEITWP